MAPDTTPPVTAPAPALTPEEWARGLVVWNDGAEDEVSVSNSPGWVRLANGDPNDYDSTDAVAEGSAQLAAVIALANAALPADSPHKITREMVDIIREAGKRIAREGNPYLGFGPNLARYADTLAALLPPEAPADAR